MIPTLDEYVGYGNEEIAALATKCLYIFMMSSSLLESHEMDNFVLRNGKALSSWYISIAFRLKSVYLLPISQHLAVVRLSMSECLGCKDSTIT